MSLPSRPIAPVPDETARIARAAFPKGNLYLKMRDEFGVLYNDACFADLFPKRGQPAEAPWCLALVTLMQFVEGLSDRQAADAVRSRMDWKYALSLELSDAGFDSSVLCEFRTRLVEAEAEQRLFEQMLSGFKERGLLKVRGRQRTDSTHVLAAIRSLNRLECIGETLRHTLNVLAQEAPEWLVGQIPLDWFDFYSKRFETYRLPKEQAERETLAVRMGKDGFTLLTALGSALTSPALRDLPAVETLRQVWVQQFGRQDGQVYLRQSQDMPPSALLIRSAYDAEARFSKKRSTEWTGGKVHHPQAPTCQHVAGTRRDL